MAPCTKLLVTTISYDSEFYLTYGSPVLIRSETLIPLEILLKTAPLTHIGVKQIIHFLIRKVAVPSSYRWLPLVIYSKYLMGKSHEPKDVKQNLLRKAQGISFGLLKMNCNCVSQFKQGINNSSVKRLRVHDIWCLRWNIWSKNETWSLGF